MFCKHLGTFKSKNQVTSELTASLKQAGDVVSYYLDESGDTILYVSYRRDLVFYQGDILHRPKPFLIKPSTEQTCINTIKVKNYKGDIDALLQTIKNKLKVVCGFDFDLTLTVTHTFFYPDFSPSAKKENQLHPIEAKKLLAEFSRLPNCIAIIISNNYKVKINEYLRLWFDTTIPFREVFGREDFHVAPEGNKEVCFYYFYRQMVKSALVDDDSFLNLETLASTEALDIVQGYMFDDEPMPSFAVAGLNVIKVAPLTRSYLIELKYLFRLKAVQYDMHEAKFDEDCVRIFKHTYSNSLEHMIAVKKAEELAELYTTLGSPLHLAVRAQLPWLVKLLLTQGANLRKLDKEDLTAAHYACLNSDITVLAMLLGDRKYADLVQILVKYAIQNNLSVVLAHLLIGNQFNLDLYDEKGLALIHHASIVGNPPMIKALLKAGASKDLQTGDVNLRSPLHLCVSNNKRGAVVALLEAGANPLVADVEGMYPGQLALVLNKELPEIVTATGIRINDRLKNGRTLLTHSIINYLKDRELPIRLLQIKAINADLSDGHNNRPMELAKGKDFGPVIVALELRGVQDTPVNPKKEEDPKFSLSL